MNNCTGQAILRAYSKIHGYLSEKGFKPSTHWIYNEYCESLNKLDRENKVDYQLANPCMHKRNVYKQSIVT